MGLVPTMGYLHEGHLSLVRQARRECDRVVVSLFVNPIQFGPQEDLAQYPRDLARDVALTEELGTDVLFIPGHLSMYPAGFSTWVEVGGLTEPLCGRSRPGHFRGVTTVVAKLFNLVFPARSYFGQKDYQQALVISRMAKDLNWPMEVLVCPTVREKDGLAMSSRNSYLNEEERRQAVCLYQALQAGREAVEKGERSAREVERVMTDLISNYPLARVDYVEVRRARDLAAIDQLQEDVVLVMAVWLGKTRLIDNSLVEVRP